jgi:hypothetical protein
VTELHNVIGSRVGSLRDRILAARDRHERIAFPPLPSRRCSKGRNAMQIDNVNLFAVLAAAVSNFLIGGLWYSPALFHRAWMRENGFSEEDLRRGNPAVIFGLAFLFSLLMAGNLAGFLSGPDTDLAFGIVAGVLARFGWVALSRSR